MAQNQMTVAQLMAALKDMPPEAPIEFALKTYTQRYPSWYGGIESTVERRKYEESVRMSGDSARIWIHLGEGYTISKRKTD